jgi:hypothetical protein
MIIKDRRNEEQLKTHRYLVIGTDRFMSRWRTIGGASYAAWACETLTEAKAKASEIRERSDMKRVRIVHDSRGQARGAFRPDSRYCAHFSVYVSGQE